MYAQDIINLFEREAPKIYKAAAMNTGMASIIFIVAVVLFALIGYRVGKTIYDDPQVEETHKLMRAYVKEQKSAAKEARRQQDNEHTTLPRNASSASANPLGNIHYKWIKFGQQIKDKVESHDYWQIKDVEKMLEDSENKYLESKNKKWIIMCVGLIIGVAIGYYIPKVIYELSEPTYDRSNIDRVLNSTFGNHLMKDALTDELMLVAYSFNKHEPRFYTKFGVDINPNVYNVTIADAAAATSATPIYFQPKRLKNKDGTEEVLIDGAVIASNPSLYSYVHATMVLNKTNVRVVSLGAGQQKINLIDPKNVGVLTWLKNIQSLIFDVEVASHDFFTNVIAHDYHRFQIETQNSLAQADKDSMQDLYNLGKQIIKNNGTEIKLIVREICDEKYNLTKAIY